MVRTLDLDEDRPSRPSSPRPLVKAHAGGGSRNAGVRVVTSSRVPRRRWRRRALDRAEARTVFRHADGRRPAPAHIVAWLDVTTVLPWRCSSASTASTDLHAVQEHSSASAWAGTRALGNATTDSGSDRLFPWLPRRRRTRLDRST